MKMMVFGSILNLLSISLLLTVGVQDLQLLRVSARPQCNSPEYWCHISPNDYAEIEIGEEEPAKIACTIPYTNGHDIRVINQYGDEVRQDPELRDYVKQVMNPLSNPIQHTHNKSFHLEIYRPKDEHVQDKLRVIQCIGLLRGSTHPCRTSLINIHFSKEEDTQTPENTTSNASANHLSNGLLGQPQSMDVVN